MKPKIIAVRIKRICPLRSIVTFASIGLVVSFVLVVLRLLAGGKFVTFGSFSKTSTLVWAPLMGAFHGALVGFLLSVVYSLAAKLTGGLVLYTQEIPEETEEPKGLGQK